MRLLPRTSAIFLVGLSTSVLAFQNGGFRQFSRPPLGGYYETAGDSKHEFAWSRLQYNSLSFGGFGRGGGAWSRDYPKADITFLAALRRLTRIDARSYQQVVDLDHEDIFTTDVLVDGHPDLIVGETLYLSLGERQVEV